MLCRIVIEVRFGCKKREIVTNDCSSLISINKRWKKRRNKRLSRSDFMDVRKQLEKFIDTKGLTDEQIKTLWENWQRDKGKTA